MPLAVLREVDAEQAVEGDRAREVRRDDSDRVQVGHGINLLAMRPELVSGEDEPRELLVALTRGFVPRVVVAGKAKEQAMERLSLVVVERREEIVLELPDDGCGASSRHACRPE